jgi:Flp pilus assembly protein TadB
VESLSRVVADHKRRQSQRERRRRRTTSLKEASEQKQKQTRKKDKGRHRKREEVERKQRNRSKNRSKREKEVLKDFVKVVLVLLIREEILLHLLFVFHFKNSSFFWILHFQLGNYFY